VRREQERVKSPIIEKEKGKMTQWKSKNQSSNAKSNPCPPMPSGIGAGRRAKSNPPLAKLTITHKSAGEQIERGKITTKA
jgi:tartrate dehydratase alpha subunit/fumarate hydratase class I-like protein